MQVNDMPMLKVYVTANSFDADAAGFQGGICHGRLVDLGRPAGQEARVIGRCGGETVLGQEFEEQCRPVWESRGCRHH